MFSQLLRHARDVCSRCSPDCTETPIVLVPNYTHVTMTTETLLICSFSYFYKLATVLFLVCVGVCGYNMSSFSFPV